MTSGGARARSGPAPDPNAFGRNRDVGDWTTLPAEGRKGRTPKWPLEGSTKRELLLWRQLWRRPQAVMWERYDQGLEVALYVRRFTEAEHSFSVVNLSTLVRQMADSLGLTTPGLRANRWRIADPERSAAERSEAPVPARPSSRSRLKVIRDDVAGS